MGKSFEQPPKGPKLGPVKDFKDLTPEQREKIGDFDKISQPAALDPRVVEAEKALNAKPPEPPPEPEVAEDEQIDPNSETQRIDVAEELDVLRAVLDRQAPEVDPDEEAIAAAATPTDEDKQRFMRCLFGDVPYAKEYKLFGGMLIIEMVDIPPSEEDAIFTQLSVDQREGKIETQDDWDLMLDRYRMKANIHKVHWSGQDIEPTIETTKNSVVYRAMIRTLRIFRRHLDIILERAMDSDFWEVDGSSSQPEPTSAEPSTSAEPTDQPAGE